ncbi:phenylacetate--CoA ligase family protein [Aestuariibacter salexigens]|uniref:phenylacetate--CoA ligase family protein n=1 Tax=Aestuariibacter salexigens TaxID=226010 RepID=UPI0003F4C7DE|nr:phenylacetate--CoA ligase family protein [Aestuariibacter salexigens]
MSQVNKLLMNIAVPVRLKLMNKILSRSHWHAEQIRDYQTEKLKHIIKYCWEYVPFYQKHWADAGIDPLQINTIEQLCQLPLLTKADVRNELESLTTTKLGVKYSEARTGGSTGSPVIFRMTKFDEEMSWAQMYVGWTKAGYSVGDPFLIVGGESVGAGLSDNRTWKDKIINRWVTSGSNLTLDRAGFLAQSPHFHKIRMIYGYPSAIHQLGEFLNELGTKPQTLKGIICTAEVLRPEIRNRIEQLYGVKALDQYGLNDGGLHACEGPEQQGLHLSFHRGVLEVIDDDGNQVWKPGETGRAIATCFTNSAMPFIRYETGDRLHWLENDQRGFECKWPRLGPIDGRTGDIIKLPSGKVITMPGLTLVMRWLNGLHRYQFIQRTQDEIDVVLDVGRDFTKSKGELIQYFGDKISAEIRWNVIFGKPELTKNGKLLIVVNKLR